MAVYEFWTNLHIFLSPASPENLLNRWFLFVLSRNAIAISCTDVWDNWPPEHKILTASDIWKIYCFADATMCVESKALGPSKVCKDFWEVSHLFVFDYRGSNKQFAHQNPLNRCDFEPFFPLSFQLYPMLMLSLPPQLSSHHKGRTLSR